MINLFKKITILMLIISSFSALANNPQMLVPEMLEKCQKLFKAKHNDQAINCYNEVIKLDPKHEEAYFNKGLAQGILGKYQEATETCNAAIKYVPNYAKSYSTEACTKKF